MAGRVDLFLRRVAVCWPLYSGHGYADSAIAEAASEAVFDVLDFRIDGNTVLDERAVERAVYPYLGPGKTVDEVEQARAALEKAYHDAGYETVFVDIPEQDVVGGMVVLQVVEGKIERLKVSGAHYFSPGRVKASVPALAEGQVPHMPTVQAELASVGEASRDREVTPVIRAGTTPGRLEVDLQIGDRLPLHGSVELNTRNSINTTRTRLSASLRYDNLWQRFHSASVQYLVSPENADEVEVWSGTYAFPTGWENTRLALYGIGLSSTSDVSAAGALAVVGSGEIFGLRLMKPFATGANFVHSATLGVDYKSFGQSLRLLGADTLNTPISYLPFVVEYDGSWSGTSFATSAGIGLHFSIRGLGNDQQEFEDKRLLSQANYLYLAGEFGHRHVLPGDFRLVARLSGQYADSPLISNEQFSAGGPTSVRGYHQTELLGDHGVTASLELHSPSLPSPGGDFPENFRALIFAEGAALWIRSPLPGTAAESQLASAGAGLRLQWWKNFFGELDWAYPLIATEVVRIGEQRMDFRVAYQF